MFSVIVPVFNHSKYLYTATLSALRSPLVDEVLMVDDGSSDDSLDIIERLTRFTPRVRNITAGITGNLGAHERLNQLCREAKSDWIAVLNSDDEFTDGRFELIRLLIRQTRCQFLAGSLVIIDEAGRIIGTKRGIADPEYKVPDEVSGSDQQDATSMRRMLCSQNFLATTSAMTFHRELFQKIGGFSNFRYVHDWDFALRATMLATCNYTAMPVTKYRIHPGNTIGESSSHPDGEIVRMFARYLTEYPDVERDPVCRVALASNMHLAYDKMSKNIDWDENGPSRRPPKIRVSPARSKIREMPGRTLRIEEKSPWEAADYVCFTEHAGQMPRRALENATLCLAHVPYDFVIVSETLEDPPTVCGPSLQSRSFVTAQASDLVLRGAAETPLTGRVIRIPTGHEECDGKVDLRNIAGFAQARFDGAKIAVGPKSSIHCIPMPVRHDYVQQLPFGPQGDKPVVFILPIFLAVGGAERNMIEVVRALRHSYEFIVITTERLFKHQGSLHFQLDELDIMTFDLAEIGDQEWHLPMLETLRRLYAPKLVWICNGSPWLAEHSQDLRRVFSHIPIVDQQVYDASYGWIDSFADRGVQSFDRFIAINSKIRTRFASGIGIPPQRIDLIYHAIRSNHLRESRSAYSRQEQRRLYGLSEELNCFAFVGRLTLQKRPLCFLDLARKAQDHRYEDHFLLVGDGELAEQCDDYITGHTLKNVTRIRFVKEIGQIAAMIDGLIITSIFEGLPIVLLEMLSFGKPALSTDVGDIGLLLDEYQSGSVIPGDSDSPSLWAAFLKWRAELPLLGRSAERSADSILERFSAQNVAKQYDQSWRAAMKEYSALHP